MSPLIAKFVGRRSVNAMLLLAAATLIPQQVFAQQGNGQIRRIARTRDFDEYQKFLIDSEKNFPAYRRNIDSPDALLEIDAARIDVRSVRDLLSNFASDASKLTDTMHAQYQQSPELRRYLTDSARLRARLDALATNSGRGYDIRRIAQDFRAIDRDWRSLAHDLSQIPRLNRTIAAYVKRMNTYDQKLGDIFQIRPQLDRRKLISETASMTADLENLMDDIEIELSKSSQANQLIADTRRLRQQVRYIETIVAEGERYESIEREYERFGKLWASLYSALSKTNNRYIDRSVQRVASADHEMRNLLWMESQADHTRVIAATQELMRRVDDFYARTPLKLIIQMGESELALAHAETFYGVCQNLEDCAQRNEDEESLLASYRYVDDEAKLFLTAFRQLRSPAGQAVLNQIEGDLKELENELNYSRGVDFRMATELAAALENLAEHIEFDVKTWLSRSRPSYANEAMQSISRFVKSSRRLHLNLQRGASDQETTRREVAQLYAHWQQVYFKYLRNAQKPDRDHIVTVSARIIETLFDMKTAVEPPVRQPTALSGRQPTPR